MRSATAGAAFLPIGAFLALDPSGWYVFGPAKWLAVAITVAGTTALVLRRRSLRVPVVAAGLLAAVTLLMALAALTGRDPASSWLGTAERHLGVVAWVLFACCLLVGAQLRGRGALAVVARGVTVATLGAAGYAIVELVAGPPIVLDTATARLGGPFGSAAYLGAAMCLGVPVAAGLAAEPASPRGWRIIGAGAAVLGLVALAGSGARGAWLGLAIAVAVGLHRVPRGVTRRVVVAAAVAAATALAVGAATTGALERAQPSWARADEWRLAVRVIADDPLLGTGPEGYRITAAEVTPEWYERRYGREVAPDRAHNGLLDVAATSGLPGGALYAGLAAVIVVAAVRVARRGRALEAGMAVAVVAYLTQQVVLFPLAELDPVLWLLAGAVVVRSGMRVRSVRLPQPGRVPVPALAAGIAAAGLLALGLTGVAADRLARQALTSRDLDAARAAAERAARLRPDVPAYRLLLADTQAATGTLAGADEALATVAAAARRTPQDPLLAEAEARARSRRAEITGAVPDAQRAVDAWRALAHDVPTCARCLVQLGAAAALAEEPDLARAAWQRAATLTDDPLPRTLVAQLDRVAPS